MDTTNAASGQAPSSGTDTSDRAWEAEKIAEADAEIAAGLYVDADEMRAWVDSLRTGAPRDLPPTRRR